MEVHPGAKKTEHEDNLAILFLERDAEFAGKICESDGRFLF